MLRSEHGRCRQAWRSPQLAEAMTCVHGHAPPVVHKSTLRVTPGQPLMSSQMKAYRSYAK